MNCPRCQTPLEKTFFRNVISFSCPHCHGQAMTLSGLRSIGVEQENLTAIWRSANAGKLDSQIYCPECRHPMRLLKLDNGNNIFYIDLCTVCHILWFDFGELAQLPVIEAVKKEKLPITVQDKNSEILREYYDDSPPTLLDHLGINEQWTMMAVRLLIKLIFRI